MKIPAAVALAAGLSACAGVPAAIQVGVGALATARSAYCLGITEGGKQAIREVASAGRQIIHCREVTP